MKIITEGVLVLASAKALKEEYSQKEFDYDFPAGLSKLLERNAIIALTTMGGDNVIVELLDENEYAERKFTKTIDQHLTLKDNDELLVLGHASFTQICEKGGDHRSYDWPVDKIEGPGAGYYEVKIGVESLEGQFERYKAYYRIALLLNRAGEKRLPNCVADLD